MASLVQSNAAQFQGGTGSLAFSANPTAGNLLVAVVSVRAASVSTPSGWTAVATPQALSSRTGRMYYRAAPGGAVSISAGDISNAELRLVIMEFDIALDAFEDDTTLTLQAAANSFPVGPLVTPDVPGVLVGYVIGDHNTPGTINFSTPSGYTQVDEGQVPGPNLAPYHVVSWRDQTATGTHTYTPTGTTNGGTSTIPWGGIIAFFSAIVPFDADFSASAFTVDEGDTIDFTDESSGGTGTPNAWAWDFGDGNTSTSQDPSHTYDFEGTYTVSLTVTTDDAEEDTETKVAYIHVLGTFVPPEPSNAIIEIRAASPGSARWGIALWGEDVWAEALWQDVTPQSVDATVRWGSHQPEYGILAETEAATWIVNTYDPERLLDPGNTDSPYSADLRAGLPIRIRHRGTIVRQGVCEVISFFHADSVGGIRATDNLSLLARTPVPEDSIVADTLRARARDVIAAAGLSVTVEPDPPSGDPALAPRLEGDRSVWRHIADAAEQTLHVAYIDRLGTLKFRAWADPYDRARGVDATELVELGTIVSTAGLYSVVQARELDVDGGDLIERRLTPTPRYGAVTYTRDEQTIDPDAWADAVLADRGIQGVQWVPGTIYPLTADAVEKYATMEAIERLSVQHDFTEPVVNVVGIIVGGEFRVRGKRDSSAIWEFEYELAQTALAPLYVDGADPPEFLLGEGGDHYLYPD